ncbi:hypothetical protein IQ266_05380 [filamentous cyanobacterium LEGE 11480]|uniref:Ribosomal protein L7/L12 C-terminal domain-containing protein n=1 Tax=Romeriopsis navalis LEGE 11480 TaxID=2777977 RepID=A0A928Z3H0_9CYAN|nr:hypothetical protein [Romeriopsis navalis]MBE9029193.1 hypothetical protein [Romeriopsis navalis LEGE 11480]
MNDDLVLSASVLEEIHAGRKIEAIRALREQHNLDLPAAKAIVDREMDHYQAIAPANGVNSSSMPRSRLTVSSPLSVALAEISAWIDTSQSRHAEGIRTSNQLRPGLDRPTIERTLADTNVHISEEVYELYQWHDGKIVMGDYANAIIFMPLHDAVVAAQRRNLPGLPIFVGDAIYCMVDALSDASLPAPIRCYDGFGGSEPQINTSAYAPSLTSLMQAAAECIRRYDGISAYYMADDPQLKLAHPDVPRHHQGFYQSLLDPIYAKYGIKGFADNAGSLWR